MTDETQIKPASAIAGTVTRDLLVVVAALPILVKLVGARDLTAMLQWLQSSDGATFLAIVIPVLVSGWRAWWSLRKEKRLLAETPAPAVPLEP